jgi:hypothetical protein
VIVDNSPRTVELGAFQPVARRCTNLSFLYPTLANSAENYLMRSTTLEFRRLMWKNNIKENDKCMH